MYNHQSTKYVKETKRAMVLWLFGIGHERKNEDVYNKFELEHVFVHVHFFILS